MGNEKKLVGPVPLQPDSPERLSRHTEYAVVGENIRFLSGARFVLLAFAATVHTALLGAFRQLVSNPSSFGGLAESSLWALPTIGAAVSTAVLAIDWRNRKLYSACLERGKYIEAELGVAEIGGFYRLGEVRGRARLLSHSWMLRAIHFGLITVWLLLWYYRGAILPIKIWA